MTSANLIFLLIGIFLVEVLIPWNMGAIRSRPDDATAIDVLKETLSYSRSEIFFKASIYGLTAVIYHIDRISTYSAIILMAVGGYNLFYLKKGQPK